MKGRRLKSVVFLLILSSLISFVSAGDVIFRDGKIISSGNVSTDEKFIGDGSKITNITAITTNPFNQNLNTTNDVTFRNLTVQNISSNNNYITTLYPGGGLFLSGFQSLLNSPAINFGNETTLLANIGVALASGHYSSIASAGDLVIRATSGNIIWAINESDNLLFSENRKNINITNNVSAKSAYFSEKVTAKNDVCLSNGKCLNKTIEVVTDGLVTNNSIIYFNNNTQKWTSLSIPPSDSTHLAYCTSGGLQWMGFSAFCPL